MIYYHNEQGVVYQNIFPEMLEVNRLIKATDWQELANGSYQLSKKIQLNVFDYQTKDRSETIWEVHRQHIDIHCVLEGQEWVDLTVRPLVETSYDATNDGAILVGNQTYGVSLDQKHCLLLMPGEAHRTGVNLEGPSEIRKAVFKVKVEGEDDG